MEPYNKIHLYKTKALPWEQLNDIARRTYNVQTIINQNNQYINFIKTRIDLDDNSYSDCKSGSNDNCSDTRQVGIGRYIRFDVYVDEIEYHVVDINNIFVNIKKFRIKGF